MNWSIEVALVQGLWWEYDSQSGCDDKDKKRKRKSDLL